MFWHISFLKSLTDLSCTYRLHTITIALTPSQSKLHYFGIPSRLDLSLRWITYWMLPAFPWVCSYYSNHPKTLANRKKEQKPCANNSGEYVRNIFRVTSKVGIKTCGENFNLKSHDLPTELSWLKKTMAHTHTQIYIYIYKQYYKWVWNQDILW